MSKRKNKKLKKHRASQRKIEANMQNAQLSTGPRTEEGKSRSSQNSLKHGLTGMFRVLSWESHEEFMEQFQLYVMELRPKGFLEYKQVLKVAQNEWRINRLLSAEADVYETSDSREALWREIDKLTKYQRRIEGETREAMKELRRLRTERANGKYAPLDDEIFILLWDNAGRPVLVESSASIPLDMPALEEDGSRWRSHLDDVALANMDRPPTKEEAEAVLRKGGSLWAQTISYGAPPHVAQPSQKELNPQQNRAEKAQNPAPEAGGKSLSQSQYSGNLGSFYTNAYQGADEIARKQFEEKNRAQKTPDQA